MIELELIDDVAIVSMAHGKVNAMSLEFCQALRGQLDELADGRCRAAMLLGNERVFSAGVDLKRIVQEVSPKKYLDTFLPELIGMFAAVFEFPKPLVGVISGHAVAGGCVVACACDYRVISTSAKIGVPELRVGVPFPSWGMEIMRWSATPQAFRKIISTGATFSGDAAVAAGLADESAAPQALMDVAWNAVREMISVPPAVFRLTKKQMRQVVVDRVIRGEDIFGPEINRLWRDEETRDAIAAYVADRLNQRRSGP